MEHTGVKVNPEIENLIKEVIRVQLGAELTYTQLSALCFSDKLNWQHTGEYLRECSLRKRVQAEKWIRLLSVRGGQFKTERIETIVPVPMKEQLVQEQGKQLKIVLELAMGIEKQVEEVLRQLHRLAKNVRDEVTVEILEARSFPKQIEMIRQIEAQLNTLFKQEVSEYMFEKLTIKPLVQHIKEKVHRKLVGHLMNTGNGLVTLPMGHGMISGGMTLPMLQHEIICPSHGKLF